MQRRGIQGELGSVLEAALVASLRRLIDKISSNEGNPLTETADNPHLTNQGHGKPMRGILLIMTFITFSVGSAQADCLRDVEIFREHVDSLKPTKQTAAANTELGRFDRDEVETQMQCYAVLSRARQALKGQLPLAESWQEAKAKHPELSGSSMPGPSVTR